MGSNLQLPSNLEDPSVLKRFLTNLVLDLNANPFMGDPKDFDNQTALAGLIQAANKSRSFAATVAALGELQADIKLYIQKNLETKILSSSEDIAVVAEQFGTFYDQALASSWYGLTVKAGGVISGYTVGAIDTDTTTPGTEGSFFAINADFFSVAKAVEDITDPAELAYLEANNLPYGTMYDSNSQEIIPAFVIDWTGTNYNIFFNGVVEFNNINTGYTDVQGNTIINGGSIQTGSLNANRLGSGRIVNSLALNADGTINEALVSMDINLDNGSIYIK